MIFCVIEIAKRQQKSKKQPGLFCANLSLFLHNNKRLKEGAPVLKILLIRHIKVPFNILLLPRYLQGNALVLRKLVTLVSFKSSTHLTNLNLLKPLQLI
jgi:hypothetical protein